MFWFLYFSYAELQLKGLRSGADAVHMAVTSGDYLYNELYMVKMRNAP